MKRKLVLSTGNNHKTDEIRDILKDLDIEVLSKNDIGAESLHVIEDGDTLMANSIKKAEALSHLTEYMVMADDTGLFVDSLDGNPGVYSSRYAGEEGNDLKNRHKLLKELEGIEDRKAHFETVIALITEDKKLYTLEGICNGTIAEECMGDGGFGYDPIFIPEGYDKSFAQLGEKVKNQISHRALAIIKVKKLLSEIMGEDKYEDNGSQ